MLFLKKFCAKGAKYNKVQLAGLFHCNFFAFSIHLFFDRERTGKFDFSTAAINQEETKPEKSICCALCGHEITNDAQRIAVHGGHEHTFTNPHGYVFKIGCFRKSPGCIHAGEKTDEFSWFKGYAWRYALCGSCKSHLGWVFNASTDQFYGLILDHLTMA
ncbi:MAG: cereblon family protein [Spirochaetota bacterium]